MSKRPNATAINALAALLLVASLLAGCSSGSSSVRYYLVDAMDYPNAQETPAGTLAVEILDVHVPQYLERFHIATRGPENRLYFSESNQWGENLRKNLLRTLARNLSVLLGTDDVGTPLNRSLSLPDYRIQVHIEQFERDSDGVVRLAARWQVSGMDNSVPVTTHRADLAGDGIVNENDYAGIVATMQEIYGRLSEMIAGSVRTARNREHGV